MIASIKPYIDELFSSKKLESIAKAEAFPAPGGKGASALKCR